MGKETQSFIANDENIMGRCLSANLAKLAYALAQKYLPKPREKEDHGSYDKRVDGVINLYLEEFYHALETQLQLSAQEIASFREYLAQLFAQPVDELDRATFFAEGQDVERALPLREVCALVFAATPDMEVYRTKFPEKSEAQLLEEHKYHVENIYKTILELKADPKCHHGTRNILLSALTFHPDYQFIGAPEDYLQKLATDVIRKRLFDLGKENPQGYWRVLHSWLVYLYDDDVSIDVHDLPVHKFIANSQEYIQKEMAVLLSSQGINPQWQEVSSLMQNAIGGVLMQDPCDANISQSCIVRDIFSAKADSNDARTNALKRAKSMLRDVPTLNEVPMVINILRDVESSYQVVVSKGCYFQDGPQIAALFTALATNCNQCFAQFAESGSIDLALVDAIAEIRKQLSPSLKDFEFGRSFVKDFCGIFSHEDVEASTKAKMFVQLKNLMQNKTGKLYLSDGGLESLLNTRLQQQVERLKQKRLEQQHLSEEGPVASTSGSGGTAEDLTIAVVNDQAQIDGLAFEPEDIDLIIMNAIGRSPAKDWSPRFRDVLTGVIALIDDGQSRWAGEDWKRSALEYYKSHFLPLLKWLVFLYDKCQAQEGQEVADFSGTPFVPIPPNLDGLQGRQMCGRFTREILLLQKIWPLEGPALINVMGAVGWRGFIPINSRLFGTIMATMSSGEIRSMLSCLGAEFLKDLIWSLRDLREVLSIPELTETQKTGLVALIDATFLKGLIRSLSDLREVLSIPELTDAQKTGLLASLDPAFLKVFDKQYCGYNLVEKRKIVLKLVAQETGKVSGQPSASASKPQLLFEGNFTMFPGPLPEDEDSDRPFSSGISEQNRSVAASPTCPKL